MSHPLPETIEMERYRLAILEASDREALYAHFSDPRVTEFMDIDAFRRIEEADETIAWTREIHANRTGIRWSLRERETGAFLGTCGFNTLVLERGRRGEIAYDLAPSHWGRGVMQEVLGAVLKRALGEARLERVEAFVTPGNARSARLLVALGFRLEGVLRRHGFWKGRFWDQQVYGLLRDEWSPEADKVRAAASPG